MKKRHLVFINALFFGLMVFSAAVVYQFLTGNRPLQNLFGTSNHAENVTVTTGNCTDKPAIEKLADASDAQLRRLAQYQEACHSYVTNTLMTFVGMPDSQAAAIQSAEQIGSKLKAFAAAGIRPLVIAEPSTVAGENIDFAQIASGAYDPWFDAYFKRLKELGLTDAQMGIWNPLPEANLPYWQNNRPEYFAPGVNRYLAAAHKYFPQLQASIMLNSATYETTDFNWESGDYTSLLPFVKGITPGTVSYVGLQGFPWIAPQGGQAAILNAAEYLDPQLVTEAADALQAKNIWFNTGTFSTKYALDPSRMREMTPEQRRDILTTVETQAQIVRDKGYTVSVNLFSKDKSKESEETNWSYWSGDHPFGSLSTPVFTEFVASLKTRQVDVWLFDE